MNALKISQLKLLQISALDGLGLLKVEEILLSSILPMQEIP
jgi:hypothetical protein